MTLERATLVSLFLLLGVPALTFAAAVVLPRLPLFLLLLNVAAAAAAACLLHLPSRPPLPSRFSPTPLYIALIAQAVTIIAITTAYLALPDVDPYHWLKIYEEKFTIPLAENLQRPFFPALLYAATHLTGVPALQIVKYGLPLLSLLPLIPLWLVARHLPTPGARLALLFLPYASPSLILHLTMGTPQAVLLIVALYFMTCLLYASLTHNRYWHHIAGLISLAAVPFHGLAALLFSSWLAATAYRSQHRLLLLTLIAVVALAAVPYARPYYQAAVRDVRLNVSFPAAFITIDGEPNGWPGFAGFSRYYGYYAGLFTPIVLAAAVFAAARTREARQRLRGLLANPSSLTLVLMGLMFLAIAEILPRLLNIVILPERAWLFIPLASAVLFITLTQLPSKTQNQLWAAVLIAMAINLGGALYVNSLKAHALPDHTIRAARWLARSLPARAFVLTTHGPDYLDRYADVTFTALPIDFFCAHRDALANELRAAFGQYLPPAAPPKYFIFFSRQDPRHPYASRPWHEPLNPDCDDPLPGQFPDAFQEVYNDSGNVIIWQVK